MRRREFIAGLGGAALRPLVARAQQTAVPKIGFLSGRSPGESAKVLVTFREGLSEAGYFEGQNVLIEFRWAEGDYDRLPALAADLVEHQVAVIATGGGNVAAHAARAATAKIPIVFVGSGDPVKDGLVTSFNRPEGNVTGVNMFTTDLEPKRVELLHELLPNASVVGVLVNPKYTEAESQLRDLPSAARGMGLQIVFLKAHTESSIDAAFTTLAKQRIEALLIASDPFFHSERKRIVDLAERYRVPTIYQFRESAEAGGLMSYGTNLANAYRWAGVYVGKILKGAKPGDLPIQQSTKIELVINLNTAKALGLTVPASLLARADEVIE
jgi:putative tryptophan/tyrosine transport system substrate-binding protein